MNAKIRQFEDSILNLINESDLPMEVKRLVITDIYNLVLKQADKEVLAELNVQMEENNAESASKHQLGE